MNKKKKLLKPAIEEVADLRSKLIQSALTLIEQTGAAKLSLREVAKHAGVSHMAPYSHFNNKADLLCAVAAEGFYLLRQSLYAAAKKHAGSPADQFQATGMAYVKFSRDHPQLIGLMFGGVISPEDYSPELRKSRGVAFSDIVNIVSGAVSCGQFKKCDPLATAFAGWSIAHGFSMLALSGEAHDKLCASEKAIMAYASKVITTLVDGLRTP